MCSPINPGSCLSGAVENVVGDAIKHLADAVLQMFGTAVSSLGTIWVYIGTPNLTDGGGSSPITAGSAPPNAANITTILGYATWIGLVVAAAAMIWLGALIAASLRRGEGALHVGRLGLILGGVVLIAGAGSLVTGLLPSGPKGASGATLFVQSALWWPMSALAVLSVIIAGVRMAWENRAEPGKDLVRSLFTLLIVAGASVTFTQLFITFSDSLSVWLLRGSLECDIGTDKACFGGNVAQLLSLGANPATGGGLGAMLVIVLGIIASLAAFVQIVLMIARSGLLVILAGILPLSAAATNTEMGKSWFRKCLGWLIAFLLYKPAAAIVYATAFQLVGTNVFKDNDAVVAVLTGLMLMTLALVAMPALMRFVTPLVGAVAGGAAGGAVAAGAMAALPSGAAQVGQLLAGASSNVANSSTSSHPSGATQSAGGPGAGGQDGQNGQQGPSGADGGGGSGRAGGEGSNGASEAQATDGANGSRAAAGNGGSGTQAAAQAAEGSGVSAGAVAGAGATGAGAGTGAAAGTAAGGGAAGGSAAAAGAAGGPVGLAASAAVEGAAKVGDAARNAASAAQGAAEDATGEGGGPSGSR